MKSVRIRSFSGPYFPAFGSVSPYSVRIWENTDQENSKYGHFLRNETLGIILETSIAKTGIFYALFFKLKFQNMEKIMQ